MSQSNPYNPAPNCHNNKLYTSQTTDSSVALLPFIGFALLALGFIMILWLFANDDIANNVKTLLVVGGGILSAAGIILGLGASASQTARIENNLSKLVEYSELTDDSRRIAWRQRNTSLLTQALEADIEAHRFNEALVLIQILGDKYGAAAKAESFRERVLHARKKEYEEQAEAAIKKLDTLLQMSDFEGAVLQSKKIKRLYSDSARTQNITERITDALNKYKAKLTAAFKAAAENEDVDLAMDILQDLDKYLTPTEAEPLMDLARDVVGKKKSNLGLQFKLAINDHEWGHAIEIGEKLLEQFPNSRMAGEYKATKQRLVAQAKQS